MFEAQLVFIMECEYLFWDVQLKKQEPRRIPYTPVQQNRVRGLLYENNRTVQMYTSNCDIINDKYVVNTMHLFHTITSTVAQFPDKCLTLHKTQSLYSGGKECLLLRRTDLPTSFRRSVIQSLSRYSCRAFQNPRTWLPLHNQQSTDCAP
jgi:hypothetical protein